MIAMLSILVVIVNTKCHKDYTTAVPVLSILILVTRTRTSQCNLLFCVIRAWYAAACIAVDDRMIHPSCLVSVLAAILPQHDMHRRSSRCSGNLDGMVRLMTPLLPVRQGGVVKDSDGTTSGLCCLPEISKYPL